MNVVDFKFLGHEEQNKNSNYIKGKAVVTYKKGFWIFKKYISRRIYTLFDIKNGIKTFNGNWYFDDTKEKCNVDVTYAYMKWLRENVGKKY